MNKFLLINKPVGWTSFDVVAKVRSELSKASNTLLQSYDYQNVVKAKKIKVGHAGTLDPFATGLLIVLVGDATKDQDKFMKLDKEYEATLKLGYTSTTGDPEGRITPFVISTGMEKSLKGSLDSRKLARDDKHSLRKINEVLSQFTGEITQTPPKFSAIKIKGKKAYELARAGEEFEIASRRIKIYKLQITNYKFPNLSIRVRCSSGTYIRTLAEDIGKALGTGAYLTALRRTKIGKYSVDDAQKVEDIIKS